MWKALSQMLRTDPSVKLNIVGGDFNASRKHPEILMREGYGNITTLGWYVSIRYPRPSMTRPSMIITAPGSITSADMAFSSIDYFHSPIYNSDDIKVWCYSTGFSAVMAIIVIRRSIDYFHFDNFLSLPCVSNSVKN
ncbi:hypothetical protein GUITHDRAFT_109450 [Guillardia theta CCMP2712]|uniref:Endonuclease/exonuclease/phosphatase domain-containing protein n=1 Tax=Guillardia theta (strain CCMP2712) TaxID=905079 RepID=L1J8K8_GUITC|nr:hypothetical protein GUITHDRAFT_109450 [Guillardia theta CCMP2712]EKX44672.1 hypothetical protein GUITHDRAFT_109450 [Guillardia theta CCMP2712]|eukprot:XP_005831652.1 hypothetical protein GUITHDRAFT_109450 [Guillardia theta CCMP2712]